MKGRGKQGGTVEERPGLVPVKSEPAVDGEGRERRKRPCTHRACTHLRACCALTGYLSRACLATDTPPALVGAIPAPACPWIGTRHPLVGCRTSLRQHRVEQAACEARAA